MDSNPSTPESGGSGGRGTPDLASLPRPVLISGIGALILFISVFLDWYSVSVSVSGVNLGGLGSVSKSASGWDSTDVAKLVALCAIVAFAALAVEAFAADVTLPAPAWQIAGGSGAIALVLVLYRLVSKPGGVNGESFSFQSASLHVSVSDQFGIYLALLAAIAVVAGAVMSMREA